MKYIVTSRAFEGRIFNGTPITIGGEKRFWNNDLIGRSYPKKNVNPYNQ